MTDTANELHALVVQLGDALQAVENDVAAMSAKIAADTPQLIDGADLARLRDSVEALRGVHTGTIQATADAAGVTPPKGEAPQVIPVTAPTEAEVVAELPVEQGQPTDAGGRPIDVPGVAAGAEADGPAGAPAQDPSLAVPDGTGAAESGNSGATSTAGDEVGGAATEATNQPTND